MPRIDWLPPQQLHVHDVEWKLMEEAERNVVRSWLQDQGVNVELARGYEVQGDQLMVEYIHTTDQLGAHIHAACPTCGHHPETQVCVRRRTMAAGDIHHFAPDEVCVTWQVV